MSKFKFTEAERDKIARIWGGQTNLQDRIDFIESLLSEREEWISVAERLPEPVTEVICFTPEGYGVELLLFDGDRRFYTIHSDEERSPTKWQPLPEPPKSV